MQQEIFCGIDFGTSNSSIAVVGKHLNPQLIPLENQKNIIPSTIFYEIGQRKPFFGSQAIERYILGYEGRFMRSLKRVLGTELMENGTILNGKIVRFENILSQFINNLKEKAESKTQQNIFSVVMGRPVHFKDNDNKADLAAEKQLESVAKSVGFKNVFFQYEPIAAAYAHEAKIENEKLACVIDIGGGTSDFSIIRIGGMHKNKINRTDDILANTGVRIGGNDFDKDLAIKSFMPEFGINTTYGKKNLPVPSSQYFDIAEWSKVNSCYNYKNIKIINEVLNEAHTPELYQRLLELYEKQKGHELLKKVEDTKISLSNNHNIICSLEFLSDKPEISCMQDSLNLSIEKDVSKIKDSVAECLKQANVQAKDIDLIILTGGSTEIPYVKQQLCHIFENAELSDEDKLSSVGLGLAYDCLHHF